MIASKPTVVIFSGAGLSAESGIPTFRDSNGLWHNHRVQDVASPVGWANDKQLVLAFYWQRLQNLKQAEPNAAHKSIARLQERFKVINFTQNVDDLLERAGCDNVEHMHGVLNRRKCEWHRDIVAGDGDAIYQCDYKAPHTSAVKLGDLCPNCGGQLRPDVVWFGESVKMPLERLCDLFDEVKATNGAFICIGTSAQVYPAAFLITFFETVANKYIVDKNPTPVGDFTLRQGNATEEMSKLADELLSRV